MLLAIIAAVEATLYSAARSKQGRVRRQQLLMGNSLGSVRALPLVDDYLKQKTARATRFQSFLARKLAEIFRRLVNTRSFYYLLLHLLRTAINKRRNKFLKMRRVML
jgi:hypothetical protein